MSHIRSAEIESRSVFFVVSVHSLFYFAFKNIFQQIRAILRDKKCDDESTISTTRTRTEQQKTTTTSKQARAFEIKSQPNC